MTQTSLVAEKPIRLPALDLKAHEIVDIRNKLGLDLSGMVKQLQTQFPGIDEELYKKFESGDSVPSKPTQGYLRQLEAQHDLQKEKPS